MKIPQNWRRFVVVGTAVALFLITLFVYVQTLSPTINSFDSAELITGAYTMGIIHAPGYPLYLLLAHAATQWPGTTPAYAVNFLSALFGAGTAVFLFLTSWRLTHSLLASLLATLLAAFSRLFWSQSVIAEVYTLNTFLISAWSLAVVSIYQQPQRKYWLWLGLLVGLSVTHHPSTVLLLPGLLPLLIHRLPRSRTLLLAAGLALLPFLLFLYLPWRSLADPALNYVSWYFSVDLTMPGGVLWMMTGRMFATELFGRPWAATLREVVVLVQQIWLNLFGAGLLLAVYGLYTLRREPVLVWFWGLGTAFTLFFFAAYNVIDHTDMILPALVLLVPPLAYGLQQLGQDLLARWPALAHNAFVGQGLLLFSVGFLLLAVNWSYADRSRDWSAYQLAGYILATVEPDALIITQWTKATPLQYMQIVEGQRLDVEILDRGLLALGIRDAYLRQGEAAARVYNNAIVAHLQQIIQEQLPHRPIYITEEDPILDLIACYKPIQTGLYRITCAKPLDN